MLACLLPKLLGAVAVESKYWKHISHCSKCYIVSRFLARSVQSSALDLSFCTSPRATARK